MPSSCLSSRRSSSFQTNLNLHSFAQIETDQDYSDAACLHQQGWVIYNVCQEYQIYYTELKALCNKDTSFADYFRTMEQYRQTLRNKLLALLDHKHYTYELYKYYFKRLLDPETFRIYDAVMDQLSIDSVQKRQLFNYSKAFHSLKKLLSLYEPITELIANPTMSFKPSPFVKGPSEALRALPTQAASRHHLRGAAHPRCQGRDTHFRRLQHDEGNQLAHGA
jgi:hypothetical protein